MGLRKWGMRKEATYKQFAPINSETGRPVNVVDPSFFQDYKSGNPALGSENIEIESGSRMTQAVRAGWLNPEASVTVSMNMNLFIWYLYAFLGNSLYTAGEGAEAGFNVHQFWGGENASLPSFCCVFVEDDLERTLHGAILDELSFEASDGEVDLEQKWVYASEYALPIDQDDYYTTNVQSKEVQSTPLVGYDFSATIGNQSNIFVKSISFNGKNNLDVDNTKGTGSRELQRKPFAGKRDIEIELTSVMEAETLALILAADYGEKPTITQGEYIVPSACKVFGTNLVIHIELCTAAGKYVNLVFPSVELSVEKTVEGSDTVEVTFKAKPLGKNSATFHDGKTTKKTDMFAIAINGMTNSYAKNQTI